MDQNPPTSGQPSGPPPTPEVPPAPEMPPTPEVQTSPPLTASAPPPQVQAATPPPTSPPPAAPSYTWESPAEPTGPAPGFRFASHGGRLVAYIIDVVIVSIVVTAVSLVGLVFVFAGLSGDVSDPDTVQISGVSVAAILFITMAAIIVSVGYFPYFWMRNGQTPGMQMFHLRVVRDRDGGPISGGQAILRLFGLWLSGAVFYLGYIWILIDARRRGWHDLIAGTVVVETD